MSEVMHSALSMARSGFAVLPALDNKAPACRHGYRDATTDPEAVARLFVAYPAPLVGVATGAPSGAAVLDIDPPGLAWLERSADRLPATVRVRTRRGGWHLWFRIGADAPPSTAGRLARGVDTRGAGAYCIAWDPAALLAGRDKMAPWPAWLAEALRPPAAPFVPPRVVVAPRGASAARRYAVGALRCAIERVAAAREGARNITLNRETYGLARFIGAGIAEDELAGALATAARVAGLSEREARATIAGAIRARAGK